MAARSFRQPLELWKGVAIAPGQRELSAILEDDFVLAIRAGLQLLDAIQVNHRRSADSQKIRVWKLRLERAQRFPYPVNLAGCADVDVIVRGFHAVDLVRLEENELAG